MRGMGNMQGMMKKIKNPLNISFNILCDANPAISPTILAPVTNDPNCVASTILNSFSTKITQIINIM